MRKANEDLTKLPKWAQLRIKVAEMRQQEAEEKLRTLMHRTDSNTAVDILRHKDFNLPNDSNITFKLGPDFLDHIQVRVARDEGNYLYVSGNDGISIEPRAANVVHIRKRKD